MSEVLSIKEAEEPDRFWDQVRSTPRKLARWLFDSREKWKRKYRDLKAEMKEYTPEWAESVSTVPAADIARIAREFAAAAPRATTLCNRGSSAHVNGYWNDRAIVLLNALVVEIASRHRGEAVDALSRINRILSGPDYLVDDD